MTEATRQAAARQLENESEEAFAIRTGSPRQPAPRWDNLALLLFVSVALVIGLGGGWVAGTHLTAPAPTASTPATTAPAPDYVYLQIKGGCAWCSAPFNNSDQYTPANFTIPSHTLIVLTITNFDNGVNPVTPTATQVSGVLGGVEYQGAEPPSSWGTPQSSVPASSMSHTFTVSQTSSFGGLNIPVPASTGPSGTSVTVMLYVNETGALSWQCLAPCDNWSMGMSGFMSGTITVV